MRLVLGVILLLVIGSATAANFTDSHGNTWRQPAETLGFSYEEVATVCSTTPREKCEGKLINDAGEEVDFTEWSWATRHDVCFYLFVEFIVEVSDLCEGGLIGDHFSPYTATWATNFLATFNPTLLASPSHDTVVGLSQSQPVLAPGLVFAPSVRDSFTSANFDLASSFFTISVDRAFPHIGVWLVKYAIGGCSDSDGDSVCDELDICPGGDDDIDSDGDSVPDFCDACVHDPQNDVDGDGVCGDVDACPLDPDNDADGDGICGDIDFCPLDSANDADGDGICGDLDICPLDSDNDVDGDGLCSDSDLCPLVADPAQVDTDGDMMGDACDLDDDNDGADDGDDNCPLVSNPDQADTDGDGAGNLCDTDDDNDSVIDSLDACLMTVTGEVVDATGCSISDLCPCESSWKNHGAYLRCVAHAGEDFVVAGIITETDKDAIVSAAGMSRCGARR